MGVNSLSFEQSAALLNLIRAEATGTNATSQIVNSADFVSVATTTIAGGYDPVMNAITQVLGRTIFSDRRYRGKLGMAHNRYISHIGFYQQEHYRVPLQRR